MIRPDTGCPQALPTAYAPAAPPATPNERPASTTVSSSATGIMVTASRAQAA